MKLSISRLLTLTASGVLVQSGCAPKEKISSTQLVSKPNLVVILADDLGFGDLGCFGPVKIKTPNIDRLASSGLRFTNGYCTSATSTPSRLALLTGGYPWKNNRAGVLPGDEPLLIDPAQTTLPGMLRNAGYTTGIVGKWYLGLRTGQISWNSRISPGPNESGFDYAYIVSITPNSGFRAQSSFSNFIFKSSNNFMGYLSLNNLSKHTH